jgi:predicted dehydrogenase
MSASPAFAFAVSGVNHSHIYEQTEQMLAAGCTLKGFYSREDDAAAKYLEKFPAARRVADERELIEDPGVRLMLGAGINSERTPMALRAMRAGKDVMLDKPAATTLDQLDELKRVAGETGRIVSVLFSEHLTQRATIKAGELVHAGAIGRVVQTVGLGPHREGTGRPDWYYRREKFGGILCDIAAHQFEQFLFFTGAERAEIVASQVGNFDHAGVPEFEDFGDVMLRADTAAGYIRVDWFTPDGLPTWGDGRLFVLGTEGYIELRKYVDPTGRPGGNHLILVDGKGLRHIDCNDVPVTYGERLRDDVLNRTETVMPQARTFLATELALTAQARATKIMGARPKGGTP